MNLLLLIIYNDKMLFKNNNKQLKHSKNGKNFRHVISIGMMQQEQNLYFMD